MPHTAPTEHPFIDSFREAWREPTLDTLMAPLRDDVTLIQPLSPPLVGKETARRAFRRILFRFPGMRGEIHGGLGEGSLVMIDWTMIVPIGRHEIRLPVIDKFILKDGMVEARVAYFDPTPLIGPLLRSPRALARHAVSGLLK